MARALVMSGLAKSTFVVFAALFPIVNPLGAAPIYITMTSDCSPATRMALVRRVSLNSFMLLLASLFIGSYILAFFGISLPVVQVAGGLVVTATAWAILNQRSEPKAREKTGRGTERPNLSRAFYPLTLPLTVGPGSISVAITLGASIPRSARPALESVVGSFVGIVLISISIFLCYKFADRMQQFLGESGTSVLVRLSAFILVCIGVQITWNGVYALIAPLLTSLAAR